MNELINSVCFATVYFSGRDFFRNKDIEDNFYICTAIK